MSDLRIGISGWTYKSWRGSFYPQDLPASRELRYASEKFNAIELNGTHYRLQTPATYQRWYDQTPDGFLFSVKGSRYITHMKRLNAVEPALANFFASGVLRLKEKLGPLLWQFPPHLPFDLDKFEAFADMLPRNHAQAARIAKRHDHRVDGKCDVKAYVDAPLRHCFEVRHESFKDPAYIDLLRRFGIASVIADTAGLFPYFEDDTADFRYVRLHGKEELYVSGYSDEDLSWWADRIVLWRQGRLPADPVEVGRRKGRRRGHDVYVFFDNDAKVKAPFDAMRLEEMISHPDMRIPAAS